MNALPMLTFTKEGETFKSQTLEKEISIGRGEGNVIRLEDRAVSRKHAVVRKTEEGVHIEKQSDFAPIRLNGVECTRALLKEGDVVEIGPYRMRLDTPKEAVREAPEVAVEAVSPPVAETLTDPDATAPLSDKEIQIPEAMPPDNLAFGGAGESPAIGDFTGEISADGPAALPDLARPISADSAGAEAGSRDPGTDIFSNPSATEDLGGGGVLDLDLGSTAPAEEAVMPEEISMTPFDENAATKVISSDVNARLEIAEGMANVTSLPLAKDEIVLGRGKECDVVLNDKKSSRKNTAIVRDGNHYRVKDLDSSNGTYVNNSPVKDIELSADDVIRIGDVEIRFIADSAEYERRKEHFAPVEPPAPVEPGYLAPEGLSPFTAPISGTPIGFNVPPVVAPEAPAPATRKGIFGIIDKYIKNFGTLKPLQKLLVVLCAFLFVSWYFEDELGLTEPAKPAARVTRKAADGKPAMPSDYDSLDPAKRAQIDDSIRKATDFLRLQDFDKAIYEVQQRVLTILPDYPQGKEIERYAQEGKRRKDAIAEEARRKEEEAKLKARIVELENTTRDFMEKKQYEQAKESFSEILSIDPDNGNVASWKKEIEAWTEEQDRIQKEKEVQEEINKRAWDTYNEGFELHKDGKYRDAIDLYKKVAELGANDAVLLKKAATMIRTCLDSIRELREPHLKRAKEFELNGDLASAFKEFKTATEIDPPNPEGWSGMDRIRDVLTERSKILYTEGVIAESYSDFKTAHDKFTAILKTAPEGSLYYQRAQRKLRSFLSFQAEVIQ
jgi:pSer/pThr/pTyr-binding forkhead associated (FHA) protein/tetratricopeptide (TPR) repeat protein